MRTSQTEWDLRWLDMARQYALWSKDPSTKVGAIIVRDGRPLSQGWNGLPRKIQDDWTRLNDRELKYAMTVHAEMNAILNAAYVGVSLKDSTLYVDGLPVCSDCAKGILQSGIARVVMRFPKEVSEKWRESFLRTLDWFDEAKLDYDVHAY